MADVYDATRVVNEAYFNAVLDLITEKYPPSRYGKLLEPGIGTGRIGIALAERGYSVTGIDIAPKMLKVLAGKLKQRKDQLPLTFKKADVTDLPFKTATFDIAVVVHVFHLIRPWQKAVAEVLRVLKPNAPLINLTTGAGTEIPSVNNRYRELCAEWGQPAKNIGMPGLPELKEYVAVFGRKMEIIENRWQWTTQTNIGQALAHIELRHYAMTRLVPESIHDKAVKKLKEELLKQYGTLDTTVESPNQMRLVFITSV